MIQQPALLGTSELLEIAPTALFCSARCPGSVILKLHETARALASTPVVSGFHTPAERECLSLLLRHGRAIKVPARALPRRVTPAERAAIDAGRYVVVSPFPESSRQQNRDLARRRNEYVLSLAARVLILHASPGGETERVARLALAQHKPLATLDDPSNVHLIALGAIPLTQSALALPWPV